MRAEDLVNTVQGGRGVGTMYNVVVVDGKRYCERMRTCHD